MSKIRIYHPELKKRVCLYLRWQDDAWPKKLKLFAEKILEFDGPISIRRAAKEAGVHRETAGKYLDIMEQNDLLMSATEGVPPRKVYLISQGPLLKEFYDELKKIRDRFFNRDPPPAIETDKARGFDDWGPDSQKLVEDLGQALWT